ncbi:TetR family transcriptional regulator [Longimycelium tulufanense]|uniref:TetR family transcriptional regulator n=1 Tax=Longimycelium tulufanense TaxID=907463 RepID=A0A8J3C9K4_9PSEU|nr:TetR/AcrR family transcriptional regulator [Longimycelium tulufanense]GGM35514.1 TetR family transcriptional regulator [Longimycelium tulufanense]
MTHSGRPPGPGGQVVDGASTRERILRAAEELFAESGFEATPTSRIAERAGVPKGLVHYYFRRKPDLLAALVARLPDEPIETAHVVVTGDVAESLRRLVGELDERLGASPLLSHLLWREADTHEAVREALIHRFQRLVEQIRNVITAARPDIAVHADTDSAARLLALAVSYRHSVARHGEQPRPMARELTFLAEALARGAGTPASGAAR